MEKGLGTRLRKKYADSLLYEGESLSLAISLGGGGGGGGVPLYHGTADCSKLAT